MLRDDSSEGKESACNVGDQDLIPGLGRSPGEGNGNPLQYSCLENSIDGRAWQATVHGVAKSGTGLSDFTSLHLKRWLGQIANNMFWGEPEKEPCSETLQFCKISIYYHQKTKLHCKINRYQCDKKNVIGLIEKQVL